MSRKLSELKKGERAALVAALTQYTLHVSGHEGYAKAGAPPPFIQSSIFAALLQHISVPLVHPPLW